MHRDRPFQYDHRLRHVGAAALVCLLVACGGEARAPVADTPAGTATASSTVADLDRPVDVSSQTSDTTATPASDQLVDVPDGVDVDRSGADDARDDAGDEVGAGRAARTGAWAVSFEHFTGTHHVVNRGEGYVEFQPDGSCTMDVESTLGWMAFGAEPQIRTIRYVIGPDGDLHAGVVRTNGIEWVRNPVAAMPPSLLVDPSDATRWPLALLCAVDPFVEGDIDVDAALAAGQTDRDAAIGRLLSDRPECASTLRTRIDADRDLEGIRAVFAEVAGTDMGGFTATVTHVDGSFDVVRHWLMSTVSIRFTPTDRRTVAVPDGVSTPTLGVDWSCDRIADELLVDISLGDPTTSS